VPPDWYGGVRLTSVVWVLLACAVVVAIFAPLAMRMYAKER